MVSDAIALFFLFFSQLWSVLGLIVLVFFLMDKKIAIHALGLTLLGILWNITLKITFKVPLAAFLMKEGFAFPSGHMQLSIIFYSWIGLHSVHKYLKACLVLLLVGIGYGLIHFGYHTLSDIIGAVFSGGALILVYLQLQHLRHLSSILVISSSVMMFYIHYTFKIGTTAWCAWLALLCLAICREILCRKQAQNAVHV